MPKRLQFLDREASYDFPRRCITVPALVDRERVLCVVSGRLLMEKFRAKSEDDIDALKKTYWANKGAIQQTVRQLIEDDQINDKGEVILTSATYH
jgi:hypothetical protein